MRVIDAWKMAAAGVRHWLSSLNLPEQYETLLIASGYNTLAKCEQLNDAVLEQIGIKPVGHRRRILLHLPGNAAEPSTPAAYDSEEDDREIYDIPPVARKSAIVSNQELMYTNFAEMNEIPKPVLPPKRQLSSSDEVDARLGIVSPPVKPYLAQSVFGTSSCSVDSVRSKPKLCVVHPEKRPPVPARRVSKDGKASSVTVTVESQLNNNIEGFDPGQLPVTATVSPVNTSCASLKLRDTLSEDDRVSETVAVVGCQFSEPHTTAAGSVNPVLRAKSVDTAPKPSPRLGTATASVALQANRLNSGLEHELQEYVSNVKKSALRTVSSDIHTEGDSSGTGASVVVQFDDSIPACSVPSNTDRTVVEEERSISALTVESNSGFSCEATVAGTTSDLREVVDRESADSHRICAVSDEAADADRPSHLLQNQGLVATEFPSPRDKTESQHETVRGAIRVSVERDSDQRYSDECHYSPPSFPPPPLPAAFASYNLFQFPTHLKTTTDNRERSSRTSRSSVSGFADFAEERSKQTAAVKPQPLPRRYQSGAEVMDEAILSPTAAGFSDALDNYLTQKVTSPAAWLDQDSEYFSPDGDVVSDVHFESFVDNQPAEDIGSTSQFIVQLDSNFEHVVPASNVEDVVYEFRQAAKPAVYASMRKGTQDDYEPLSADNSQEVACNKETGD